MATYNFGSFQVFAVIPFDPYADVLDFTGSSITSFADLRLVEDSEQGELIFLSDATFLFLQVEEPWRLTQANFVLPDGGLILIGDDSNAWRDDALANTLIGGAGSDFIAGFDGNDSIDAGAGNDFIFMFSGDSNGGSFGKFGADTINGGAGFDIIRITDVEIFGMTPSYQAITGSLGGTLSVGAIGSVSIIGGSIEGFVGGQGNDNVSGTAVDNYLHGGGGNDTLSGLDGNDTVFGSFGNDTVDGGAGNDVLRGGFGNDTVQGGTGNDTIRGIGLTGESIDGGAGTDELQTAFGVSMFGRTSNLENLTLISGVGPAGDQAFLDLLLAGNTVIDVPAVQVAFLEGNAGANLITGNSRFNFFSGGPGNDTFVGGGGFDIAGYDSETAGVEVTGGITAALTAGGNGTITTPNQGTDQLQGIFAVQGGEFNDSMSATGNDANWFSGGSGNDSLSGGDGNDTLTGQSGSDSLAGGTGEDMVSFHDSETGIVVDLSSNTVSNDGRDNSTLGGFQAGSDVLSSIEHVSGDIFADSITGSSSANRLRGGGHNDTLVSGGGNDSIDGGDGNFDNADFSTVTADMSVSYADGTFSYSTTAGTIAGIEALRAGSGNDTLEGGNADITPTDYFWQSSSEQFEGGAGDDSIDGVHTGDGYVAIARYNNSTGAVTVNLGTGLATGDAGNDTLANIDGVFGGSGNDSLTGGSSSTNLDGDLFEFFSGGLGNDSIDGAGGIDRIDYHVIPGAVTIDMSTGLTTGAQGNDSFSNIEGVRGSSGADSILGDGGENFFEGLQGNDTIDGGLDNDTVRYDRSSSGVTVNLSAGTASDGFGGTDSLTNIENAVGSDYSDTFISHVAISNFFDGKGGARQDGFPFPHRDTVDYSQGGHTAITVDLALGTVTVSEGSSDTLANIEFVIGTSGNDSFAGSDTSIEYTGLLTDRTESYRGNGGDDTFDGGSSSWGAFDTVDYSNATAGVFVSLQGIAGSNTTLDGGNGLDDLINIDGAIGSLFADNLMGGSDSRSFGGTLFEVFRGNGGNDTIFGGDGFDVADYTNATGSVNISLGDFGPGGGSDGLGGTDQLFDIEGLRGGQFNDRFEGSDNNDREIYEGNAGDDFIDGVGGLDVASYRTSHVGVYVDLGHAFGIDGWGGVDNLADIEGAAGSDFADTLIGGYALGQDFDGWQVFEGRAGNDSIDGADDFDNGAPGYIDNHIDAIEYRNAPNAVFIDLVGGTANDGYGDIDTFVDIEIGSGSRFNDTIIGGDAAHDSFEGFDGRAGDDSFVGGTGNDWVLYEESEEGVYVDLAGGTANDGWGGTDTFTGMEHVLGSRDGDDTLIGNAADNFLHGDDGDDVLRGGAGNDSLDGADGHFDGSGVGYDLADYSTTANAVDVNLATNDAIAGADGNDLLTNIEAVRGSAFDDTLTGDAWDNLFEGGEGNDSIQGGDGPDWVTYENDPAGANVDLQSGVATDGFGDTDFLRGIENVRGGDFNDTLQGSNDDNVIEGGLGNDSITTLLNNGADTLSYRGASGSVNITLDGAGGTITGAAGDDTLAGTVAQVIGSAFGDNIDLSDVSGVGRIFVNLGGGADTVAGSDTELTILSFEGYAAWVGMQIDGFGFGLASQFGSNSAPPVFVDLSATGTSVHIAVSDGSTTDLVAFSEIDGIVGNSGNDNLIGDGFANYLQGGAGWDSLSGGLGNDTVSFRDAINPVIVNLGGSAQNSISYFDADGHQHSAQNVQAGQALTNANDEGDFNADFDSLSGFEAVEGGDYNDTIFGSTITETMLGGAGNDVLRGGGGNADVFVGGLGFDQVNFGGTSSTGIKVNLGNDSIAIGADTVLGGTALRNGTANVDQLSGIEQVIGTGLADTIIGGGQTYTGVFHDFQSQFFFVGDGADSVLGAAGDGIYTALSYNTPANSNAVTFNLATGRATIVGGNDTFSEIDEAQGGSGADTLIGGGLSKGYSGHLHETFRGGAGNDSIDGSSGEDRVDFRFSSTSSVNVTLGNGTLAGSASDGQGGTDTLRNVEGVRGSVFSDTLTGGGTHNVGTVYDYEVFEGMEGNDSINGGAGFDIAVYGASDAGVIVNLSNLDQTVGATLVGAGKALDGFGTRDTLLSIEQVVGSDYADTIFGSNDVDVREAFRGGAGNDFIDGGGGNDAVYYNASPNAVQVDLAGGVANDGYGYVDTFTGIEGVRGSIQGDVLLGGAGNERFEGIQGADTIDGGGGDDLLDFHRDQVGVTVTFTGAGSGTAVGWLGTDTFTNIEAVRGTLGFNDTIIGGDGNETIDGSGGNDFLDGGLGNDVLSFRSAPAGVHVNLATSVIGGAGNDTFSGFEAFEGTDFNDTITTAANYVLDEGFEHLVLAPGALHVSGAGNALNNSITGNIGHNTLDGGAGNDTLAGGAGNDRYVIDSTGDVIVETLTGAAGGVDEVVLSSGFGPAPFIVPGGAMADEEPDDPISYTLAPNLENVFVSGTTTVVNVTANAAHNFLVGGSFNDTLDGGGGNDTLDGGQGIDTLKGGAGNDTYYLRNLGDVAEEAAGAGIDTVLSSLQFALLGANLDHLTLQDDVTVQNGRGNNLNNYLKGNSFNNQLFGGDGNDTLEGGGGADRLYGGAGSDSYVVDGNDLVIEVGGSKGDQALVKQSVDLSTSAGIEGAAAQAGIYGIDIHGNKQGNKINGNETNNRVEGGKAGKVITADTLDGGLGSDTYVIASTLDKIIDTGGTNDGIETDFSISLATFATIENLYQVGSGNIIGVGNALGNLLRGNLGNNLLSGLDGADDIDGGAGNDTLDGGKGNDRLYGGAGDDTYVLDSAADRFYETVFAEAVSTTAAGAFVAGPHQTTLTAPATVISGDGRYVQFTSAASTLVTGDTNGTVDTFVRDMATGAVTRVSVGPTGGQLTADVTHSAINPGGRFVAFTTSTGLLGNDTNGASDVYLRDWNPPTGTTAGTVLLSQRGGTVGNGASVMSDISQDGRFVAISSDAWNLVVDDANDGFRDVFLIDRLANTLLKVSVADDETAANDASGAGVAISAGGLVVAFTSTATNLVEGGSSAVGHIFVRDLAAQSTALVSVDTNEVEADAASLNARISNDGRYVVFESAATNLVAGDTNGASDIFLRDLALGTTTRVSVSAADAEADGASSVAGLSGDGRYVVFQSAATNLVAGDTNGAVDVFVKDLQTGAIARVSSGANGGTAPDISEDGRYIAFTTADPLGTGDAGSSVDVYRMANPLIMGSGGIDTIVAPFSFVLGAEFENLTLSGTLAINGTGNDLDNVLTGNTAVNSLSGGLGNDTYGVTAGDLIADTDGDDDLVISLATWTLQADLEHLTLAGTTALAGTGNAAANLIKGNAAANTLTGLGGADTLEGGAGNDLYVSDGLDTVTELANAGTDTLKSTGTVDLTLVLNVENVLLDGGGNVDAIGNGGNNLLTGNTGNNVLNGGAGDDTMVGLAGNDTYHVNSAKDVVTDVGPDAGDHVIASIGYVLGATVEHLTLTGAENLAGTGNAAANSITGNAGNNVLDGKAGNDTFLGGDGDDLYIVDANDSVLADSGGRDTVNAASNFTLGDGLENLTLIGTAANGTGNALDNLIAGNAAKNSLSGGLGNDTLNGAAGADTMDGGDGDDLYIVDALGDSITGDASGEDRVIASANHTLAAGIEHLTLTGTAASGAGNAGNNSITGNAANNTLTGGAGNDTLAGGLGNDFYNVDGDDVVVEFAGAGIDTAVSDGTQPITLWDNVENLTLTAAGSATGNALHNRLTGSAGADTLDGGAGNDTLVGGAGNDSYYVDAAGDVVTDTVTGASADTVIASVSYVLGATLEHLVLEGPADINGTGNAGANSITGNEGDNYLFGGAGADTLDGGDGLFDVADYAGTTTAVIVNLGDGTATGGDLLSNIEGVRGTALADNLTGNGAGSFVDYSAAASAVRVDLLAETVSGGGGNDTISEFAGARGGAGNDTLTGDGNDNFFFVTTGDVVAGGGGNDTIYSTQNFTLPEDIQTLVLTGAAHANATGNAGANSIAGNSGDNYLTGGGGNDTLSGGDGLDVADYFNAGPVNVNLLTGVATGDGVDELADDIEGVRGGAGNDTLTGAGTSLVDYAGFGPVVADLGEGIATGAGTDALSGFRGIRGSDGVAGDFLGGDGNDNYFYVTANDAVVGGAGNDTIYSSASFTLPGDVEALILTGAGNVSGTGGTGDDLIVGNGGNNSLSGAAGNDTLDGGLGNDSFAGGEGNDLYFVNAAGDVIGADAGGTDDHVVSEVNTVLGATLEHLTLSGAAVSGTGNASANSITGNANNNTLDGGAGADTLDGGDGDDTYRIDSVLDQVVDASGFDVALVTLAAPGTWTLGEGVDNATLLGAAAGGLAGNELDNLLTGNGGANTLDGGAGDDTMIGGAGNDTYTVDSTGDVVTDSGGTGDTLRTFFSTTLTGIYATLEHLVLLGMDLVGNGNAAANSITGGAGNDTLSGGGGKDGNDTLDGGAGNDLLLGGDGNDTYLVDSLDDVIVEAAGVPAGIDTVRTSIGGTLGLNLENLVLTGLDLTGNGNAANNVITGGDGNDSLFGDAGNDTLHGGGENDTIDGGLGIDSMAGGAGDDTYAIDIATDKFSEALNAGTDTLVTPFTTVMPANFENLTLSGTNNVNATGNDLANVLAGNTGNNLLDGKGGHDSLAGGDGNDTLNGGLGNDTLAGGAGDDRFVFDGAGDVAQEAFGEGTDTLETPVDGTTLGANLENLVLTGAALTGSGNELDNLLAGNAGANTLSGGDGNDTLSGGAGADSLSGGEGNDNFLFDPADTAAGAISGGTGNDSLIFTGAGQTLNLTLAGVSERFDSLERIDIGGQGATPTATHINTLIFDFDDIRDLSEESDIVRIDGDLFDVVRSEHATGTEHWELLGVIEDPVSSGVFYIEYQYQYPNLTLLTLQVNLDLDQFIS